MSPCLDCGRPTGKTHAQYCDDCRWRHRRKRLKYALTPERRAYLQANYRPAERGTSARCAAALSVPKWRVNRWAAELGLTSGISPRWHAPAWTPEDDAFVAQHLHTRHPAWIARSLKRSLTAVLVRVRRLGLSRLPDGYSETDVALAFGVSRDTVERWRVKGLIRTRFQPRAGQPFRYTDGEVVAFIRAHRTAFEIGKCDQLWFLDLLLDGGQLKASAA